MLNDITGTQFYNLVSLSKNFKELKNKAGELINYEKFMRHTNRMSAKTLFDS